MSTTDLSDMVSLMTRQRLRRLTGSRPALGSSISTTLGFPMRDSAVHSLRFMPPDRRDDLLVACGPSSVTSSTSSTNRGRSASGTPLTRPNNLR